MNSRTLLIVGLVAFTVFGGCSKSGNSPIQSGNDTWTISGETHLLGSIEPLGGVTVQCGTVQTTSDADGKYVLKNVPGGSQTVVASRDNCDLYSFQIDLHADARHFIFMIFDGTDLSGTISNAVEGPVKDAKIEIGNFTTYSDAAGWYEIDAVPHGSDSLRVTHPRFINTSSMVTLTGSARRFDVRLQRDSTVRFNATMAKYVYERTPTVPWTNPITKMYLSTNGNDASGGSVTNNRRILLISFDFPILVNNPNVTILNASLTICTDGAYPTVPFQTYSLGAYWPYDVTFASMPSSVELLFSGTLSDTTGAKYWSILETGGFNRLLAQYRSNGIQYGVQVTGGGFQPTGFYSYYSTVAPPKVTITMRY